MKKKIYLTLIALPMFIATLSNCAALHVHTFTSPYEHDETSHWKTCSICHEKFDQHEHVFNEINNECFICNYVDPLVEVDENGMMVGLTPYGKTKYTVNLPSTVKSIPNFAFKDSNAVTVKLNKELDYYEEKAFEQSHVRTIATEEKDVQWYISDGKVIKRRVLDDNVAKIGDDYYATLADAFAAVTNDDTTVELICDLEVTTPIQVNHVITLSPYYGSAKLTCNFDITASGILYIPDTITYKGNTRLLLSDYNESRSAGDNFLDGGTTVETVNNSGSLVFLNQDECPDNVNVTYVKSLKDAAMEYPALGCKQIANNLLVIPVTHYAFGTFRFSKDFEEIKGLTEYGQTVTNLTISRIIKDVDFNIGQNAFSIGFRIRLDVPSSDPYLRLFRMKGFFTELTIGDGIKVIKENAFSNSLETGSIGLDKELIEYLYPLFSHLFTLKIGDDVEEIGRRAFFDNVGLSSVGTGASLKTIGIDAFRRNYNLVTVDLSHSRELNKIGGLAFRDCNSLTQLILPEGGIWKYNSVLVTPGFTDTPSVYFPYEMTPGNAAHLFKEAGNSLLIETRDFWEKSDLAAEPISYTKTTRTDDYGRYNEVAFTNNLSTALSKCATGGEIYLSNECVDLIDKDIDLKGYTNKNLTIKAAPELKGLTIKDSSNIDDLISLSEDHHLVLSNIKPKGNIQLNAADDADFGSQGFKNTASFAIRGVDIGEMEVHLKNASGADITLPSSQVVYKEETYSGYGLFNFGINTDTTIRNVSTLGRKFSSITIDNQKDTGDVLLDNKGSACAIGAIKDIHLSGSVKSITDNFFSNATNLETVTCMEGLTSIGAYAFKGSAKLRTIDMPTTLTSVGDAAFNSCSSLIALNFPDDVTTPFDNNMFQGCSNLSSVRLPANWGQILGQGCFANLTKLRTVTLPNNENFTQISAECFEGCVSLTSIEIPSYVKIIAGEAFNGCKELKSVRLANDNALYMIDFNAFKDCELLESFYFGNNITGWKLVESGLTFTPEELSDEYNAAKLIKEYSSETWTRPH